MKSERADGVLGISISKQIPWLRVFVEGVVIVGSILLAFGIDAAWDGRTQNQRRQALLAALGSDMALARDEVDRVEAFQLAVRVRQLTC